MGIAKTSGWIKLCKRCGEHKPVNAKHSKVCPDCFKDKSYISRLRNKQ